VKHRAPLACAVVGLGRIGSLLESDRLREKPATHASAIVKNPECVLVAGCDLDEERRKRFEKEWGIRATYAETGAMLNTLRIDILHVATPPHTHLDIVREAARRGVPVVVCEKPLAQTASEAQKIAELYEKGPVKILVNHERRYSRDYLKVKRHIETRSFGPLRSIHAILYMGERRPAFSILLDDGTHLVDIVRFLPQEEITSPSSSTSFFRKAGSGSATGCTRSMKAGQAPTTRACGRLREPLPVVRILPGISPA
jgi:predicted dehydrogenase